MRKLSWTLSIVILSVLGSNIFAKMDWCEPAENSNVIKSVIVETILNKAIEIRTTDGKMFAYRFDEIAKMARERIVDKTPATEVTLKNSKVATELSLVGVVI